MRRSRCSVLRAYLQHFCVVRIVDSQGPWRLDRLTAIIENCEIYGPLYVGRHWARGRLLGRRVYGRRPGTVRIDCSKAADCICRLSTDTGSQVNCGAHTRDVGSLTHYQTAQQQQQPLQSTPLHPDKLEPDQEALGVGAVQFIDAELSESE